MRKILTLHLDGTRPANGLAEMFPETIEETQAAQSLGELVAGPSAAPADIDNAIRGMFARRGRASDDLAKDVAAHPAQGGTHGQA